MVGTVAEWHGPSALANASLAFCNSLVTLQTTVAPIHQGFTYFDLAPKRLVDNNFKEGW